MEGFVHYIDNKAYMYVASRRGGLRRVQLRRAPCRPAAAAANVNSTYIGGPARNPEADMPEYQLDNGGCASCCVIL
jgi:hypothetical protein